jgi:hypothetical protein
VSDPKFQVVPGGRVPDEASEQRLYEIRREAEDRGEVKSAGIRSTKAPFPKASPETGYYGIPLLKKPQWTQEIPFISLWVARQAQQQLSGLSRTTLAPIANWYATHAGWRLRAR